MPGGPWVLALPWSDELELAVQPVSASMARNFVRDHLVAHGMAHLTDDVTLVVSELVTNAMVHAQTPVKVSLHAFAQTLLLRVEDGSRTGPVLVAARVLDIGGRGLAIVALLSRAWGVVDRTPGGGKSVMGRVRPAMTTKGNRTALPQRTHVQCPRPGP